MPGGLPRIGTRRKDSASGKVSLWFLGILVVVAAGVAFGGGLWRFATSPLLTAEQTARLVVPAGSGLRSISNSLAAQGLIVSPWTFRLVARFLGQGDKLQAGVYEIRPGTTPVALLDRMVRGDSLRDRITFIEGWTFRQVRAVLDRSPALRHDTTNLQEHEILERLGAIERRAEGLFFPDTYHFTMGTSDLQILRAAHGRMRARLEKTWAARKPGLPFTSPYDALVLASVVEKETGRPDDRAAIAAVFLNRLRIGMRLQSDPTVIYGLGDRFDGNLRRRDLEADSPYNTYIRNGLPPTPIALPGGAALDAVLMPIDHKALYFVARGDGSSEFSSNLDDHNRAVARYQKR
jgi:UPF0755 protein